MLDSRRPEEPSRTRETKTMDEAAAQAHQRLVRWLEESREVLPLIPALLEADQQLLAKAEQTERDRERLRREAADLRKELAGARTELGEVRKQLGEAKERDSNNPLGKEIEDLRRDNEKLRTEKDEIAQAFSKLLETMQTTNQIAQKLGVTKSPFARPKDGKEAAPATAPAPTPPQPE